MAIDLTNMMLQVGSSHHSSGTSYLECALTYSRSVKSTRGSPECVAVSFDPFTNNLVAFLLSRNVKQSLMTAYFPETSLMYRRKLLLLSKCLRDHLFTERGSLVSVQQICFLAPQGQILADHSTVAKAENLKILATVI